MRDPISGEETGRLVARTTHEVRHPWPDDAQLQGGRGIVFSKKPGETYRTHFVEAFVAGTFLRGEGESLTEAEDECFQKYQAALRCPGPTGQHDYAPHRPGQDSSTGRFRNGAGFCQHCSTFKSAAFTAAELGQYCEICRTPTMWWWGRDSSGKIVFLCEEHSDLKVNYTRPPKSMLEELLQELSDRRHH